MSENGDFDLKPPRLVHTGDERRRHASNSNSGDAEGYTEPSSGFVGDTEFGRSASSLPMRFVRATVMPILYASVIEPRSFYARLKATR
jgi:hypothetical protein